MLKSLKIDITTFQQEVHIYLEYTGDSVYAELTQKPGGKKDTGRLSGEDCEVWMEEFEELHIEDWEKGFAADEEMELEIIWGFEYEDQDGDKKKGWGFNAYPDNWEDFIRLLGQIIPLDVSGIAVNISLVFWQITKLDFLMEHNEYVDEAVWLYKETMEFSREKELFIIHKELGQDEDTTRIYHSREGVPFLMDRLDECFREWTPDNKEINEMIPGYQLIITYDSGSQQLVSANYNRTGLPDSWCDFTKLLTEFIKEIDGYCNILDEGVFGRGVRDGEYIFCSVAFSDYGKDYYYLTDDDSLEVGDRVIVPAGPKNEEKEVFITGISYYTEGNVPLPLDKVKKIIRRAD